MVPIIRRRMALAPGSLIGGKHRFDGTATTVRTADLPATSALEPPVASRGSSKGLIVATASAVIAAATFAAPKLLG